jgi:2-C-methyl-D-erythritol 4-phosphate cytidylyltransferase
VKLLFSFVKRFKKAQCSAVIVAAGESSRMGGEDKLLAQIHGKPVLAHTVRAFQNSSCINEIIVVTRKEVLETVSEMCRSQGFSKVTKVIVGGKTRVESVTNGVYNVSKKSSIIAIHDGARPCVSEDIINNTVKTAEKHHAAAPGVPVIPTVKVVERKIVQKTINRENLHEIQTPQVFASELIKAALKKATDTATDITDDCSAVELIGVPIHVTEGSRTNIKLTTPEDFVFAKAILEVKEYV